jgi:PmbA protein
MTLELTSPHSCDTQGYLLRSESDLTDAACFAVSYARQQSVDGVSARLSEQAGITIKIREGLPFCSVRDGGLLLSIATYDGGRTGHAMTQAIDPESIKRAVDQAISIARQVESDPDAGLPEREWLARDDQELPLYAPSGKSASALSAIALEIESTAMDRAQSLNAAIRVDEAVAASSDMRQVLVTSGGFVRVSSSSIQSRSCRAIAQINEAMTADWSSTVARREGDLRESRSIADEAVQRAFRNLGGHSLSTQTAPVLIDSRIAGTLVLNIVGGLSGNAQQQRSTFLVDSLGSKRVAEHVDLLESPLEPYGLASFAWDSEGVAPARRHLVQDGVIRGYLLNSRNARKLAARPTGNADGPANLILTSKPCAGDESIEALLKKMDRGLWVTAFLGGQVNSATGSYSSAVEGFWIERGQVVHPVRDVTIAGDLPTMLLGIVAVGGDRLCQSRIRTGSILIESMRIAGR